MDLYIIKSEDTKCTITMLEDDGFTPKPLEPGDDIKVKLIKKDDFENEVLAAYDGVVEDSDNGVVSFTILSDDINSFIVKRRYIEDSMSFLSLYDAILTVKNNNMVTGIATFNLIIVP
jgi:hypothetical protein